MEITSVTFRRTRRNNLGNYEHDERTCEMTARVDAGEEVEAVVDYLASLVAQAIGEDPHLHGGDDEAPEETPPPAPEPATDPDPTVAPPPMTDELFRVELARIAKKNGAACIVNALLDKGLDRASQIPVEDRRAFLALLEG